MSEWQPIETAPKDEGPDTPDFMIVDKHGEMAVANYENDLGKSFIWPKYDEYGNGPTQPTHWQPLPKPPKGEQ